MRVYSISMHMLSTEETRSALYRTGGIYREKERIWLPFCLKVSSFTARCINRYELILLTESQSPAQGDSLVTGPLRWTRGNQ